MILIYAENRALTFNGDSQSALALVSSIRDAYGHDEMPKLLNDFIFNLEMALQDAGVLDEWFSEVTP